MKRASKLTARWLIGIALGVIFVAFATRDWPLELLFGRPVHLLGGWLLGGDLGALTPAALASADVALPPDAWRVWLPGVVPYLAALVIIHYLRAWRWAPLLRPLGHRVPFSTLNRTGAVSFAAIFLLPLRIGEFVRPVMLAKRSTVPFSQSMALVVLERIIDGLAVTLALLGVLLFLPRGVDDVAYGRIQLGALLAFAVFGGGLAFVLFAWRFQARTHRLLDATLGRLAPRLARRVDGALETFHTGLDCLPDRRAMLTFVGATLVYWAINGIGYFTVVRAFGYDLSPMVGFAMMCAVAIGMMIPNPPANVGTFWFCLLLPMQVYGISGSSVQADVMTLFVWGGQALQMSLFGAWFFLRSPAARIDVAEAWATDPLELPDDADDGGVGGLEIARAPR